MKRVLEPDLATLEDWARGSGVSVKNVQRLVAFLGDQKHAIVPVAEEASATGGVRIKYEIYNYHGPNIKEKEHMPRHAIAFLDLVNPTISYTMQKHDRQEKAWDELGWSGKESKYVSNDDNWEEQTSKAGSWHNAVFEEAEHGKEAYRYFYQHRNDADQFDVHETTMDIWNGTHVAAQSVSCSQK